MYNSFIIEGTVAHTIRIDAEKNDRDNIIAMVERDHKGFQYDSIEENGVKKDFMGKCSVSSKPIFAGDDYQVNKDGSLTMNQFAEAVKPKK